MNDLLARYQERVLRIVRVQLGPNLRAVTESVDIVQDTLKAAAAGLGDDPTLTHANLLRWLSRIALNRIRDAHDYHFAQRRDRQLEVDLGPRTGERSGVDPAAAQTGVSDRAFKREIREHLDEAVARLPDDYQRVILLRDYCGGDWEFVTRELGRDNSHATRQLHQRAWIKVRQMLWPLLKEQSDRSRDP